jgi:hypothetical protein
VFTRVVRCSPLLVYPSDTTRERTTRAGIERLRHDSRHNFFRCAASIASGQAGTREVDFVVDIGGRLELFEAKWIELPAASDAVNLDFVRK